MTVVYGMERVVNHHFKLFLQSVFGRTSENYGHDHILKEYTGYPEFLPLNAQIQHGWYGLEIPDFKKIRKIPFMLVWNKRVAHLWMKNTSKPVFVLGAPFVLYREMHNIKQKSDAKGTVAFPDHSTPGSTVVFDVKKYCDDLKKLPEKLQPVTICLHFRDMDRLAPIFSENGFKVVTAGNSRQGGDGFVRHYYEILSSHKYSCSNIIGSFTFYSVDMGIPFFIYGDSPQSMNNSKGVIAEVDELRTEIGRKFLDIHDEPTLEQRELVSFEVGFRDRISARFLKYFFIKRFFLYELPRYPFRFVLSLFLLLRKFPRIFKKIREKHR